MIYAIVEDGAPEYVKIGYTGGDLTSGEPNRFALRHRLRMLQIANPRELACIAVCHGTQGDEEALHHRFREYHARGEWFRTEGAVLEWIERWEIEPVRADGMARMPFIPNERPGLATVRRPTPRQWQPLPEQTDTRSAFARVASRHLAKSFK